MSKSLLRWIGVAVVVVVGLAVPKWLSMQRQPVAGPGPAVEERLQVRVETVTPGPLEERLVTSGTVRANEWVNIVTEVAGKIESIEFEEGAVVQEGSVLVRLDTSTLSAERDRARFRAELARRQEARQRELLNDGLISTEEYDSTVGELNVLEAELELRQAMLAKAEIRAPFSGVIGLRGVSPGAYVTSQTRLTTLQDIDPVKIEFSVPEAYARELALGDAVRFSIKGLQEEYQGQIYAIEPAIDPETRSLTLRAKAANPSGTLLPGAFAEVDVAIREVPDALSLPAVAVVPELGGKKVYLFADGVAETRIVETGIRTEDRVQITRGLEPGERVIVSNIARLRAGLPVESEPEAAPGP